MKYTDNWDASKERFKAWWNKSYIDRPLMRIAAHRSEQAAANSCVKFDNPQEYHIDAGKRIKCMDDYCKSHRFMADAFPSIDLNIGPGSLAVYLGSEPVFTWDTVWFTEAVQDWNKHGLLKYNPDNYWFQRHLSEIKKAKELAGEDFLINIPDIIENIDILSALRGPQTLCFDLIDEPQLMHDYVNQLDEIYFKYYDAFYEVVKEPDGSSSYTAFCIWGPGKTAKVQCDFSALMSPDQFREFVQPSLRRQCKLLDNSVYHLDGSDALKHVDALMEIEELDALQWTAGAGKLPGQSEKWYPLYDKVRAAGKSLWISVDGTDINECVASADRLVKRYGPAGLYLLFPEMSEDEGYALVAKALHEWNK